MTGLTLLRRGSVADQVSTGPGYLGLDTFTRADGAIGTAEVGGLWTQTNGVWTVISNQASAANGSGDYAIATLDVGTSEIDLQIIIDPANGETNDMGPAVRVVNATTYIFLDFTYQAPTWLCRAFQRNGGPFNALTPLVNPIAELGGDNTSPFGARIVVGGSYGIDGGEAFYSAPAALDTWISAGSWSNADVAFRTATAHGLSAKDTAGSRFDSVTITAAP